MWASLAKQKPGREEIPQAGLTRPRPFSKLFYVACKPAGSNDHGINRLIRRDHLCVKPAIGLDRGGSINRGGRVSLSFAPSDNGILPDRMIAALAEAGGIRPLYPFAVDQIQPASLDLRLGAIAYRVRASFLPGPGATVARRIAELKLHEFSLADGAVLETGCVYIVPLLESLALPPDIAAATNPKSSTGRLDVFTRVIADETRGFDRVAGGYHGPLYAEISPKTFPVLVRESSRLSQLRLRHGNAALSAEALHTLHARERLVDRAEAVMGDGVAVSIDLSGSGVRHETDLGSSAASQPRQGGGQGIVGYRAKRHTAVIDVERRAAYDAAEFWEPIFARADRSLILDPDEFYILASTEAVQVPPDYAAEMVPFDPLVGEFRVHYAGFFDPGFGYAGAGGLGARAVLEVRSREVPFILEHGQIVGRLVYEKMLARPKQLYGSGIGSNYQAQGLKLSKHFRV
jgi:dCTP deaminase